jgi:geranylgeranyl pyrophosphate synthase
VARARARADDLVVEAQAALAPLPAGDARAALQEMARFAVDRTH